LKSIASFTHQTSHRRVHFDVWSLESFRGRKKTGRWVTPDEIASYPISNAQRRVLGLKIE